MMKKIEEWVIENSSVILFAIIAMSVGLRLFHIDYQSLWLDELYSIVPADPNNSFAFIWNYAKDDQPPLFFIYIHYVFTLFGYNELVGRIACAFAGVCGVVAMYFLGKEVQGKPAGLFAAFFTSINYFHIYYSQELRFYSMAFLFTVLSYLFFIRAFKRSKLSDYLGYVIFTICLLYTHYFGIIIFVVQAMTFVFLLFYVRTPRFIVLSIVSAILITLAFLPWIPIVIHDSGIPYTWIENPSPFFVAKYFYDYTGKEILTTIISLFLLYSFIRFMKTQARITNDHKLVLWIVVLWIVLSYLIPYIRSIVSTPLLHPRYTIVTLPGWIILFAVGWDYVKNKLWKYAFPPLLVIAFCINMMFFKQHYTKLDKDQFREASAMVRENNPNHYPIYSGLSWNFNYFFRNDADQVKDLHNAALTNVETFWLLQAHYTEEYMNKEINGLSDKFIVVEKHSFYGANAVLLKRK